MIIKSISEKITKRLGKIMIKSNDSLATKFLL